MDASAELLQNETEEFYKQLLLQAGIHEDEQSSQLAPQLKQIQPKPGFCLKTKTEGNEKVFINICTVENLPAPKDISDEDLIKLLDTEDPSTFRVPMSLGEPHAELDKSGQGCTAYDVVINPEFYSKLHERQILMGFFLTVVLEGLEDKYNLVLSRDWRILKNRKFVGTIPEQNIRTKSKPWIMEMDSKDENARNKSLISEVSKEEADNLRSRLPEPPYTILQEPPIGFPEFLIAEVHLPKVKTADSLTLDVGEDRILLQTRSNVYHLDIYLPYNLLQEECGAQFNRKTKILTLTMPVAPSS